MGEAFIISMAALCAPSAQRTLQQLRAFCCTDHRSKAADDLASMPLRPVRSLMGQQQPQLIPSIPVA